VELVALPGSKFEYSGGGYTLMQLAVERLTKRTYVNLAQEFVFGPLSMKHSSVALSPEIVATTAQGHGDDGTAVPMHYYAEQAPSTFTTNVTDFARWMADGMYSSQRRNKGTLSDGQLKEMYTVPLKGSPYALGHFVEHLKDGSLAVGHDGRNQAGFRAMFKMRPQQRDGIVFFTNSRSGTAMDVIVCLWTAQVSGSSASECEKT
jgi:CubicO group peptidase (beta-lactamase class C family)